MKNPLRTNLSRIALLLVLGVAVVAVAESVDDFKSAAEKEGCDAIPYSSLRSSCHSKSSDVERWCKGGEGKWSCDGLDPEGIKRNIENVKRKVDDLKRERDDLNNKKSSVTDENERKAMENKIGELEKEIRQLEEKVAEWQRKLEDEKKEIDARLAVGKRCLEYREDVFEIFADAKSKVRSESDPEIKPYAEKLAQKYEAGEAGHKAAIELTNKGIEKCERMK